MALWLAIGLGVLQGLTEFLPISSSAHLALAAMAFGFTEPQTLFDVVLHLGTLVAVCIICWGPIRDMLLALVRPRWSNTRLRLAVWVVLGTIPTGVLGVLIGNRLESVTTVPLMAAALCVTGFILRTTRGRGETGRTLDQMTWKDAVLIGLVQGLHVRGISRSGSTIAMGLWLGLERDAAATYSFLLSIPAVLGAVALKGGEALHGGESIATTPLLVGAVVSGVVGYASLGVLQRLVRKGSFHTFAWYCWGLAAVSLGVWAVA